MRQWRQRALVASFAVACANHGSSDWWPVPSRPYAKAPLPESVSEGTRACFESPATQAYLEELHQQIIERWDVPHGTRAYNVAATLRLEASGAVALFRVVGEPTVAQSDAITEAVRTAQPFPPLTGDATCLTRVSIHMSFRTGFPE